MRISSLACLCSTTSSAVMIFVRLAIGVRFSGLRRQSTSPVVRSTTMPARGGSLKRRWNASAPASAACSGSGAAVPGLGVAPGTC